MSRTCGVRYAAQASLMLAAFIPSAGRAQMEGKMVITPYVGMYAPATKVIKETMGGTSGEFVGVFKHKPGVALGVNGSYWFTDRAGIEFGAAYAFSDSKASLGFESGAGSAAAWISEDARMLFGSAKVMFNLLPADWNGQLRLGVGPAIVNRGGDAYKDEEGDVKGLTDVGGAVSLCTRIPLVGNLAMRLRAENYMYQTQLRWKDASDPLDDMRFDRKFQSDFILSAGLQIGLPK